MSMNLLAIMLIFICAGSGGMEKAAIQSCIDAWPDVPVSLVRYFTSLYSLVCVPVMLIISPLIGNKIRYKTAMTLGTFLCAIGGLVPFFYHPTWIFVLSFRAVMGVGVGLIGSRNALVTSSLPKDAHSEYLGYANTLQFVSGIITGPVCGWLVTFGWQYSMLINIIPAVVFLIALIFIKEPEHDTPAKKEQTAEAPKGKEKVNAWIFLFAAMQVIMTASVIPMVQNMSTFFEGHHIGSSVLAGIYISVYSVGATCGGMLNGLMKKIFKDNLFTVAMLVEAAGMVAIVSFPTAVPVAIATFVCGLAFSISLVQLHVVNASITPKSRMGFSSTLLVAANMLGAYLGVYWITAGNAIFHRAVDVEGSDLLCAVVWVIFAILMFAVKDPLRRSASALDNQ